jgi:hypothetical protein
MDLKMRQKLVQECGTITAFNYAYCKTICVQANWLLRNDITDANEEPFPIFPMFGTETGEWVRKYQDRLEATEKAYESYDALFNKQQAQENGISDYQKICNASMIIVRKGSILPVLVEHLEEQTKIKSGIIFSSSGLTNLEELRNFSDSVSLFFGQIKEFLAMFEGKD